LDQTFQDFEIVIVDNNASEDTREAFNEVVRQHPEKIRVVHEHTQGISSARNRGIVESNGVYIAFLDDDDKMYPHRLAKQFEAMERYPAASLVYGMLDCVSFDGRAIVERNKIESYGAWSFFLFGDQPRFKVDPLVEPRPSVIFCRKDRAVEAGFFDERFNPFWLEETEFYLRMWELGPFYLVPEPLVAFRLPSLDFLEKKRSGNTNWLMSCRNLNLFFSILLEKYYRKDDPDSKKKFKKIQSQWLRELSLEVFRHQDGRKIGRHLLLRAIQSCPTDPKNWKWYLRSFLPDARFLRLLKYQEYSKELLVDVADPEVFNGFFRLPED
jgi:glycosyltransferase involved in cell wall biosynthesis